MKIYSKWFATRRAATAKVNQASSMGLTSAITHRALNEKGEDGWLVEIYSSVEALRA